MKYELLSRNVCGTTIRHLCHPHCVILSHSILWRWGVHINDMLPGPTAFDEDLRLVIGRSSANGRVESHTVLQFTAIGQELRNNKLVLSLWGSLSLRILWKACHYKVLCITMYPVAST